MVHEVVCSGALSTVTYMNSDCLEEVSDSVVLSTGSFRAGWSAELDGHGVSSVVDGTMSGESVECAVSVSGVSVMARGDEGKSSGWAVHRLGLSGLSGT